MLPGINRLLLLTMLCLTGFTGLGQCLFTGSLAASGTSCSGDSLYITGGKALAQIIWQKDGVPVKTVTAAVKSVGSGITVAGGNFSGSLLNQLNFPSAIFVDAGDNVFVADYYNNRIVKWAPGAITGITVAGGHGKGAAANQFSEAIGVCLDAAGNIYVADFQNNRIQKWTPGAVTGVTVAGGNGEGSAPNQFNGPSAVCLDKKGNLYIADFANSRIQKWVPGAGSGTTVAGGNGFGPEANQLKNPSDVFVDGNDNVYVADGSNNRVQKWVPGATSGITVAGGNGTGTAANQLAVAFGVYVDASGNVYVADAPNNRIQMWVPGATAGITVAGNGLPGDAAESFYNPSDIFMDKNGNLFIADDANYRVQKWATALSIDTGFVAASPGIYTASVINADGCTVLTNAITVIPPTAPSVNIQTPSQVNCMGTLVKFTAQPVLGGETPHYQWQVNGVNTGDNNAAYSNSHLTNGDVISCIMTSTATCTVNTTVASNQLIINVIPVTAPSVTITASAEQVCAGTAVTFTAIAANAGNAPVYQWQLNGNPAGTGGELYSSNRFLNGDKVICVVKGDNACAAAVSPTVALTVYAAPAIPPGQSFSVTPGQTTVLSPVITGNITTYQWTPGTGLSDSSTRNPVANPVKSSAYTLRVTTADGCTTMGSILVKLFTGIHIPNAFTPNGDRHNDRFGIADGSPGVHIDAMTIYSRWGQVVFTVKNIASDNPAAGWDGFYRGSPAPPGTYIYFIQLALPGSGKETHKGSFTLVR